MDSSWEDHMIETLKRNEERIGLSQNNTFEDNAIFQRVRSEIPREFVGAHVKAVCVSTRRSNKVTLEVYRVFWMDLPFR